MPCPVIPRRRLLKAAGAAAALSPVTGRAATQCGVADGAVTGGHGIALHGKPKYPENFRHFDYLNPGAPKGGSLFLGAGGSTFDNLNPFIIRGTPAGGVVLFAFDRLMKRAEDEPFSYYALVAKSIAVPGDRTWAEFELDERARFHDGSPITVADIVFSFNTLRAKGRPFYRNYFRDVAKVEQTGPRKVRFGFRGGDNRELPLIIAGDLPILPRAYWETRDFERATLDPPLGSGPYRIGNVSPGRSISFERVKDYWAADLPSNRGYNNFDTIRLEYYRDAGVAREAFKAGEYDYHLENQATGWATSYEIEAVRQGLLNKREIKHELPSGMQGFIFNTRRSVFKDWRVRRALGFVFDFEWTNRNIFFGQYVRTKSYFANSEMAATGLPQGEELRVLEQFRGRIPDRVFTEPYELPVFDGEGDIREGLGRAFALLAEAGWTVREFKLVNEKSGAQLRFEILTGSPQFERIILPYVRNLRRLGIDARVRIIDASQLVKRVQKFDFDVILSGWGASESPGNEQRDYWGSAAADAEASTNYTGIKDKAIDELVELLINACDRESLVARTRALDRVLLHHHLVVPNWHISSQRILWWDKFGLPAPSRRGTSFLYWWHDAAKAERIKGRVRSLQTAAK